MIFLHTKKKKVTNKIITFCLYFQFLKGDLSQEMFVLLTRNKTSAHLLLILSEI